jgi:hypothetical protein
VDLGSVEVWILLFAVLFIGGNFSVFQFFDCLSDLVSKFV